MTEYELVGFIPQGPKGDRYTLSSIRQPPNSYATLYAQLQIHDIETGEYIDQGEPEPFVTLYDGHVQVGFFFPYVVDNEDGTATFYRQWYCRIASDSNTFLPSGQPEVMDTITLPIGPQGEPGAPGGHYLISATNPQPNVAYFWRSFQVWNPEANNGAGSWVPIGEAEQIGGIVAPPGDQGRDGDYYLLSAGNPEGEPGIVQLYRQRRHGVTGAALASPELIGQAVAIQGEQGIPGEPGEPGAPGGIGNWTPTDAGLLATEWQRLSWYAYRFMEWTTAVLVKQITYEQFGVQGALVGAGATAALAGFAIGGPPGAALGFTLGVGVEIIAILGEVVAQSWLDQLQTEAKRQEIAQGLYCSLIPARYLDTASLEAWTTNHEGPDPIALLNNSDPVGAVSMMLANHWRAVGMEIAQLEFTQYLLDYNYDPAIDYTALPCTPNTGTSQDVFDFTIDDQGWELFTQYGNYGAYVPGTGWVGTYRSGEGDVVGITLPGEQLGVTYAEVLYDLDAKSSVPGQPGVHFGANSSWSYTPEPTVGTNQVWSRNFGGGVDMAELVLWFAPWATDAGIVIKRISLTRA